MNNRIKQLFEKDNKISYQNLIELEILSEESNEYYKYLDIYFNMLNNENSYIRVRGFRMICKQSKWDKNNRINSSIEILLSTLNDEKPTAVRQYLKALNNLLLYKPELSEKIREKLENYDYSKYNDSMSPLIKKDIETLLTNI